MKPKALVLVVDDEEAIRKLLKSRFEREGFEVQMATQAHEAMGMLETTPHFSVVVTDIKMPGMDGLEVLAKAKQQDEEALVMVITAYGSLESAEEAMAKGAFDYITKPFRKEQILLAIDRAMRWRELERQNKALKQRLDDK